MDSEGDSIINERKNFNILSDYSDVVKSIWLRRSSTDVNQVNRILIDVQLNFILPLGTIFWFLFLLLWN
jgi:hypothetical protein